MTANELRIGNIIGVEANNHRWLVKIVDDSMDMYLISRNKITVRPVPLTDELLVKLGGERDSVFTKINFATTNRLGNEVILSVDFQHGRWWICERGNSDDLEGTVHQFQNAFFAKTGQELSFERWAERTAETEKKLNQ